MPAKTGWTVTSQRPFQEFTDSGQIVSGKEVTFRTDSNYVGTIFIPDSVYGNIDQVKDLINKEVSRIMAVHTLSGTAG
ncbi:MAG: hypothetical protein ACREHG_02630 [Candidatus Saccharimonadales bacterium]